jgi:hypothetical protein
VPPSRRIATLAALVALALPVSPARADTPPPPGGIADLTGARALALGAFTGVASGNDGIFVNPAATAASRRYSVESIFAMDRRGGTTVGKYLGASVVDSLSSPVAAALAWIKPIDGDQSGNLFVGGLAGSLVDRLYLGAQVRYYQIRQTVDGVRTDTVDAVTADAGLYWQVADYLTLGASGFNLVPTGHPGVTPRTAGVGLGIGSDTSIKLCLDWRTNFDTLDAAGQSHTTNRYAAGLEAMLGERVPLRAGWIKDETLATSWWSAGAGIITPNGVAIDVGYRQSLQAPEARIIDVSFKLQFLEL